MVELYYLNKLKDVGDKLSVNSSMKLVAEVTKDVFSEGECVNSVKIEDTHSRAMDRCTRDIVKKDVLDNEYVKITKSVDKIIFDADDVINVIIEIRFKREIICYGELQLTDRFSEKLEAYNLNITPSKYTEGFITWNLSGKFRKDEIILLTYKLRSAYRNYWLDNIDISKYMKVVLNIDSENIFTEFPEMPVIGKYRGRYSNYHEDIILDKGEDYKESTIIVDSMDTEGTIIEVRVKINNVWANRRFAVGVFLKEKVGDNQYIGMGFKVAEDVAQGEGYQEVIVPMWFVVPRKLDEVKNIKAVAFVNYLDYGLSH